MRLFRVFVCVAVACVFVAGIGSREGSDLVTTVEASSSELRCGWFHNPTPANAWLIDADGEWIIGIQGGYQAEGNWPSFSKARWIKTNVNYGYGCACMRVDVDHAEEQIDTIYSSYSRPLSVCRKDKALKGKEPKD